MRRAPTPYVAFIAALALPLAACVSGEGANSLAGKTETGQRSVPFFRGDVIVTGPPGYCVDPKSIQRKSASGFALMASCAHLSEAPGGYVPAAVITASVLPRAARAQMPTAARLAGPWQNIGVAQQIDGDGIAMIQVESGGDSVLPAGDPRHWRGAMLINGHLIGLAVYGDAGANVAGAAGRTLLMDTAKAILGANAQLPQKPASSQADASADAAAPI